MVATREWLIHCIHAALLNLAPVDIYVSQTFLVYMYLGPRAGLRVISAFALRASVETTCRCQSQVQDKNLQCDVLYSPV